MRWASVCSELASKASLLLVMGRWPGTKRFFSTRKQLVAEGRCASQRPSAHLAVGVQFLRPAQGPYLVPRAQALWT